MADDLNSLLAANRSSSVLQGIANPAQVNPLAAMNSAATAARNVYELRDLQAREAAGQAYQGATDENGEFSPNRLRQLLSQNPAAAMAAGTTLANTQQISADQLQQNLKKAGWANTAAGSLTRLGPNITPQHALDVLEQGVTQGILTPAEFQRQSAEVRALGSDPAKLYSWATQHKYNAMNTQQQLEQEQGRTTLEDVGGAKVPVTTRQSQGPGQPGSATVGPGGVSLGLSPEATAAYQRWLQETVDLPDADNPGATVKGTRLQFFERMKVDPKLFYPGGGGGGVTGAPGQSPLPSTLRNPAATSAPAAPAVAAPGATPATPAATTPATPQTSAGTPIPTPSSADLDYFRDVSARGVASRDRAAILGNMLGDTAQFSTGALAPTVAKLRNYGISLGIPGINVDAQTSQESFVKLAAQLANAQGAGAPSDARQAMAVAANPHQELSPAGAQLMIRQLQGNEDYLQARARLASDYKGSSRKFESEISSNLDPRAFQFSRMAPGTERQNWFKNLSEKDQAAVKRSYNWAVEKGLVGG
jgi:hypothetical protein